jgi:beta-xylosidase
MEATGTFHWEAFGLASSFKRLFFDLFIGSQLNTPLNSLSSSTGKPTSSAVTSIAQRSAGGGAVEASVIYKNGNYWYLFTSWDKCCSGTSSTYNIRVGRSSQPTGGFVDKSGVALTSGGGTLVLGSHDKIIGPGGQDLMDDNDGPILIYRKSQTIRFEAEHEIDLVSDYYTSSGSFVSATF